MRFPGGYPLRRRSCCLGVFLLLIVAGVVYWFGSIAVRRGVAELIEARLPDAVGPAKHYTVAVHGSPWDILRGRIEKATVIGDNVELRNGLALHRLVGTLTDVRVALAQRRIDQVGSAHFVASTTQKQLNEYLASKFSDIPCCRVELGNNRATVYAQPEVAGLKLDVAAIGTLRIADSHRVVFDILKVRALGVRPTIGPT